MSDKPNDSKFNGRDASAQEEENEVPTKFNIIVVFIFLTWYAYPSVYRSGIA